MGLKSFGEGKSLGKSWGREKVGKCNVRVALRSTKVVIPWHSFPRGKTCGSGESVWGQWCTRGASLEPTFDKKQMTHFVFVCDLFFVKGLVSQISALTWCWNLVSWLGVFFFCRGGATFGVKMWGKMSGMSQRDTSDVNGSLAASEKFFGDFGGFCGCKSTALSDFSPFSWSFGP